MRALSSPCKTDQIDFRDMMPFLPSPSSRRKSALMQKPSAQEPKVFYQHGKVVSNQSGALQ